MKDQFIFSLQKFSIGSNLLPWQAVEKLSAFSPQTISNVNNDNWLDIFLNMPTELNWSNTGGLERSFQYNLNAWSYFVPILKSLPVGKEQVVSLKVFAFMEDWVQKFSRLALSKKLNNKENTFAWYDMAVGLRAHILVHFYNNMSILGFTQEQERNHVQTIIEHVEELQDENLWVRHNNHGLYQSLGLLNLALSIQHKDIDTEDCVNTALKRSRYYLDQSVSTDGVHLEHSAAYHKYILYAVHELVNMLRAANRDTEYFEKKEIKMQSVMSALELPSGLLLPFGDTDFFSGSNLPKLDSMPEKTKLENNPDTKVEHSDNGKVSSFFSQPSGLVSYKQLHKKNIKENSYFAFSGWYHSNVHKHLDDLSFFWLENNIPILSDSGRYGYSGVTDKGSEDRKQGFFYANPKRQHIESERAHNTVEIDGRSGNRRETIPYGSSIVAALKVDSMIVIDAEIIRLNSIEHKRLIVYCPGKYFIVVDTLNDKDQKPRTYTQWSQFFPAWKVNWNGLHGTARFERSRLKIADETDAQLEEIFPDAQYQLAIASGSDATIIESIINEGVEEPVLSGWASLKTSHFQPSPSLKISAKTENSQVKIATVFKCVPINKNHFTNEKLQLSDVSVYSSHSGFTGISWMDDGHKVDIKFKRSSNELSLHLFNGALVKVPRIYTDQNKSARYIARARQLQSSPADNKGALELYAKAMELGSTLAARDGAELANIVGDKKLERLFLQGAIESGQAVDNYRLGAFLLEANTTEEGQKKALALLSDAGQNGQNAAWFLIGLHSVDKVKALAAFKKGANMEHAGCMREVAKIYVSERKPSLAISWYEKACKAGSRISKYELALLLLDEKVNYIKEIRQLLTEAEQEGIARAGILLKKLKFA